MTARSMALAAPFLLTTISQGQFTIDGRVAPGDVYAASAIVTTATLAQTFTAPASGVVDSIGLQIYATLGTVGDLTLFLVPTQGGDPVAISSGALTQQQIPIGVLPIEIPDRGFEDAPLTIVTLLDNVSLVEGQQYAVVLRRTGEPAPPWANWNAGVNTFSGGAAFRSADGGESWGPSEGSLTEPLDYGFVVNLVPACTGDVNGDNMVGLADVAGLIARWAETVPPAPVAADQDGNGMIGLGDIAVVIQHWASVCD